MQDVVKGVCELVKRVVFEIHNKIRLGRWNLAQEPQSKLQDESDSET